MIPKTTIIFLIIFFQIFPSTSGFLKDYYCGTGLFSKVASFLSTAVCDRDTLNLCCEAHDMCYGSGNGTRAECDAVFCECSGEAEKNKFCQWWIGVSHCRMVKALGERPYARSHRLLLIPDEPI
uniref:Phospholipase A(2) n=1 Tax=Panagrolaimus superbus TaxID=310955 RepID=A0A914Y7N9_9BILA